MTGWRRFAVYYTPEGGLARWGAAWLGWDPVAGREVPQRRVPGLDLAAATAAPRRYGFHATMKAPFRPAEGVTPTALAAALARFCAGEPPVALAGGLIPARLGGFVALVPARDSEALTALESRLVEALDRFRASPTADEIARRIPERLTPAERENLRRWGYPWVRELFRFHMTLSDSVDTAQTDRILAALRLQLPPLPDPFPIDALSLMGEDAEGRFHLIARHPLGA